MKQIKSKKRVKESGEVFTAEREVKAMCDLIPPEQWTIDSTFLEPTCGNGNFLVEILRRKLLLCENETDVLRAYQSIYGIELQDDNVLETRIRLLAMAKGWIKSQHNYLKIADILANNIICGNSLEIMLCIEAQNENKKT